MTSRCERKRNFVKRDDPYTKFDMRDRTGWKCGCVNVIYEHFLLLLTERFERRFSTFMQKKLIHSSLWMYLNGAMYANKKARETKNIHRVRCNLCLRAVLLFLLRHHSPAAVESKADHITHRTPACYAPQAKPISQSAELLRLFANTTTQKLIKTLRKISQNNGKVIRAMKSGSSRQARPTAAPPGGWLVRKPIRKPNTNI